MPLAAREVVVVQRNVPVFRGYDGDAAAVRSVEPPPQVGVAAGPVVGQPRVGGAAPAPKPKATAAAQPAAKTVAAKASSADSTTIHPEYHELSSIKSYSALKAEVCCAIDVIRMISV